MSEKSHPSYPFSRGSGATADNTQRVVLATDSPGVAGSGVALDSNIVEVKGVAISTGLGATDAGTIRVALSSDTPVNLSAGDIDLNTDGLESLGAAGNASLASIDGKITAVDTGAVVVASSALPSGASTSAAQTTGNNSLASIDGKITAVDTGAVVVASSALPTGAATSANQATEIASLASIDGKITAVDTGAVTISSALPAGSNIIGNIRIDQTTPGTTNGVVATGPAAHDAAATANPLLIAAVGRTQALPAATTANDVTYLNCDRHGRLRITGPSFLIASSDNTPITTATDTTVLAAPGAGNHYRIYYIHTSNSNSTVVDTSWRDGASGVRVHRATLPQYAQMGHSMKPGAWDLTSNTALVLNTNAAASVHYTVEYEIIAD